MMKHKSVRLRVISATIAAVLALQAPVMAVPRLMSDEELDLVCAKGSRNFDFDMVTIRELIFQFAHHSAVAQVVASGVLRIEANTTDPNRVQVRVGQAGFTQPPPAAPPPPQHPLSGSVEPVAAVTATPGPEPMPEPLATVTPPPAIAPQPEPISAASATVEIINGAEMPTIEVRAIAAVVRVTADIDVSVRTLPAMIDASVKDKLLIPPGLARGLFSPGLALGHMKAKGGK